MAHVVIEDLSGFIKTCVCGRTFNDLAAFTRHEKGCRKGKKRLSNALAKAKQYYRAKKPRLGGASASVGLDGSLPSTNNVDACDESFEGPHPTDSQVRRHVFHCCS